MPPRKKGQPSRQTTLLDRSPQASPPTTTSKSLSLTSRKRKRNIGQLPLRSQSSDNDSDNQGLSTIKLEPKRPSALNSASDKKLSHTGRRGKKALVTSGSRHPTPKRHNSSSQEETPQLRRRRLTKRKIQAVESSSSSDEPEKERILSNRLRARGRMTTFQKHLERLKRRKQGKPSKSPSSRSDDSDAETDAEEAHFKGAKPSSDFDSLFDEDSDAENSSDFIVEDDNAVPATLPTQFSMETYQDLDHQFKKIFQFFVHIAVRPAKERHEFMKEQLRREEYFSIPLQVVRRKLSGMRDSLVASSVWRPEFKRPVETYPEFDLIPLSFAVPACDACHLGGRISTLIGRLSGLPYDHWGFEINDKLFAGNKGSDSDDDDDDDDDDDFEAGEAPTVVEFNLGRFCARRTRVYHEFTHWEYTLFKCIRDEVDDLHASNQSGGVFRIAYAGGRKPPKDLDDADGICEWLDQRMVIDMQWEKIKAMMESARHLELASKRGDDD